MWRLSSTSPYRDYAVQVGAIGMAKVVNSLVRAAHAQEPRIVDLVGSPLIYLSGEDHHHAQATITKRMHTILRALCTIATMRYEFR